MRFLTASRLGFIILSCSAIVTAMCAEEQTRRIAVDTSRLRDVAAEVSRVYEVSVCCESAPRKSRKEDNYQFIFALDQATLKDTLQKITSLAPGYTWAVDNQTGIVNIYPSDTSLLDWEIPHLAITNKSVREIFEVDDALGLRQKEISFFSGRGNLKWLDSRITLQASKITARQALNLLCTKLPFKARWELFRLQQGTPATLMFRGYTTE